MPPRDRGAEPLVELRGAAKTFAGGVTALAGLDLSLAPGELLTLLGPSGCGKSTALRLIAGLAAPTAGTVERHLPGAGGVGFVFQEPTLMPWATVERNVELPLRLLGLRRTEVRRRTAAALEWLGLDGFGGAFPRTLSGGMRMRVALARALAPQPRLLLLDEPFAALDEITRWKLDDDLLALWREQGLTVVFVTHSVYEAAYLSTRIVVLSARPGRVVGEVAVPGPATPAAPAAPPAPLASITARGAAWRGSADYGRACSEVGALLARAVGAS